MEKWIPIIGLENKYLISNQGRVKSLPNQLNKEELIRKPVLSKRGYLRIFLYKNKKQLYYSIHRLVAIHFIPNPNNYPEVNHKDGNKLNNNDWNLEWNTGRMNKDHAIKNGLYCKGEDNNKSKLTENEVIDIYNFLKEGVPFSILIKVYNVSKSTINTIKSGSQWKHLKLIPIKGRASSITIEMIEQVEELLKFYTIRQISRITGYARETISNIKNKKYEQLKYSITTCLQKCCN